MNIFTKIFLCCVLFLTILGWLVFADKKSPHCSVENCPSEFVILLQLQISQMFFLGFQCVVLCFEGLWPKMLWFSWCCVAAMVLWVFLFECYTVAQNPTILVLTNPFEWFMGDLATKRTNRIFISVLFLNPIYLFAYLLFMATKQINYVYAFVLVDSEV